MSALLCSLSLQSTRNYLCNYARHTTAKLLAFLKELSKDGSFSRCLLAYPAHSSSFLRNQSKKSSRLAFFFGLDVVVESGAFYAIYTLFKEPKNTLLKLFKKKLWGWGATLRSLLMCLIRSLAISLGGHVKRETKISSKVYPSEKSKCNIYPQSLECLTLFMYRSAK